MAKSAELDELYSESAGGGKSKAGVAAPVKHNVKAIKFLRDRITSHLPAMVPRHMMNEFKLHDTNRDNTIDKEEFYRMMSRYHIKISGEDVDEIFAILGTPPTGSIDAQTFIKHIIWAM